MAALKDELGSTRWSLIGRLKNWEDRASWQQFFDGYWKLIYRTATRSGLTASESEEVVQETILSVAHSIKDFDANPRAGAFKGWLLLIARRRIADQFRKRKPEDWQATQPASPRETGTGTTNRIPDSSKNRWETLWDEEWRNNVADAALEAIKHQVSPKQYKIFYLHVLKNQPAQNVCQALNINIAQVYLAKHRVSALLKQEVKRQARRLDTPRSA